MDEGSATIEPPPVIENPQQFSRWLAWLAVGLLVVWYVLVLGLMGYSYSVQLQVEETRSGGSYLSTSSVKELYDNRRTVLGIASVPLILIWTAALVCLALTERQSVTKRWWMAMVGAAVVIGLVHLGMSMYMSLLQEIFIDWMDEHYRTAQIFLELITLGLGLGLMLIFLLKRKKGYLWLCLGIFLVKFIIDACMLGVLAIGILPGEFGRKMRDTFEFIEPVFMWIYVKPHGLLLVGLVATTLMLIGWLCLMLPPAFGKPTRPAPKV